MSENQVNLGDLYVMGIEKETYKDLLDIARKQGKTVNDVTSEALKKVIDQNKGLQESKQKKLLMEG